MAELPRLRPNAIGLFRLKGRHSVLDQKWAVRTRTLQALVFPNVGAPLYELQVGRIYGNLSLRYPGIVRQHFEVMTIRGMNTNTDDPDPTAILRICNQPDRTPAVKMRVHHHNTPKGEEGSPYYVPNENFVDLRRDSVVVRTHHTVRQSGDRSKRSRVPTSEHVRIGDTVELFHRPSTESSTFFLVVGLSSSDSSTVTSALENAAKRDLLDQQQLLPQLIKWLQSRSIAASVQAHLIQRDGLFQQDLRNIFLEDVENRRTGFVYQILSRGGASVFEAAAKSTTKHSITLPGSCEDKAMDKKILEYVEQYFRHADFDTVTVNDINQNVAWNWDLTEFTGSRATMIRMKFAELLLRNSIDGDKKGGENVRLKKGGENILEVDNIERRFLLVQAKSRQAHIRHLLSRYERGAKMTTIGMKNPGNLCYMITVIQALIHMRCIREIFHNRHFFDRVDLSSLEKINDLGNRGGFIAIALHTLINDMISFRQPPDVTEFQESLVSCSPFHRFVNDNQQDANEFMHILIDYLSVALHALTAGGGDPISDLFRSKVIGKLTCINCQAQSTNTKDTSTFIFTEIFGQTIDSCLDHHFRECTVERSCPSCETCHQSLQSFKLMPRPILLISLKRFDNREQKNSTRVTFDLDMLDTSSFMSRTELGGGMVFQYKLCAVINHHGRTINSGHYDLFMRKDDDTWLRYDDDLVEPLSEGEVVNPNAYVLIYCIRDRFPQLIG